MNYDNSVLFSKYIKILALSVGLTGFAATAISAASLTPDERNICPTIRVCVDIIRRHDASEFDYDVLEGEFRRFGLTGRKALFDVLNSQAGNPDIARMISKSGPLNPNERSNLKKNWSLDRADIYLPFLLDGHPLSRDFLLLTLGSKNPNMREQARVALLDLPQSVERQAISQNLLEPLMSALIQDPIAEAAPYISRLNPKGKTQEFSNLLKSAEASLVFAAYEALYRHDPSEAFKTLLSEMDKMNSPIQSQAIGEMLLRRHAGRADGFYLKFAEDISGDRARSVAARASGLHAVLVSPRTELPELTPARAEALQFLVSGRPFAAQDKYLPQLKKLKAEKELQLIWRIATAEKWINRDRVSTAFEGLKSQGGIIGDLIRSDDFRSFSAGALQAKSAHQPLLRAKVNHPIKSIQDLARKTLKMKTGTHKSAPCIISSFDSNDRREQMPFFDLAWMKTANNMRVVLERKYLTAAHPSQKGWLAGYNLQSPESKSNRSGAALVHFDNKTGEFKRIGDFSGPVAILPDRFLKLGQSTNRFWLIDKWGGEASDVSAYSLDLTTDVPRIRHLGVLPGSAQDFSVAPNGDLLMRFEGEKQAPIRMSSRGEISLACRPVQTTSVAPAPN